MQLHGSQGHKLLEALPLLETPRLGVCIPSSLTASSTDLCQVQTWQWQFITLV